MRYKKQKTAPGSTREAGFSLVSVIAFAAVLGGIVAYFAQVQRKGSLSEKTFLSQNDALLVSGAIASLLSDHIACQKTFGGLDPTSGASVTQVKDQAGHGLYSVGTTYGNRAVALSAITVGGSGAAPRTKIPLWSASAATSGQAVVMIDWQPTGTAGTQGLGPSHILRGFLLDATIDAATNKITDCTASTAALSQSQNGSGTINRIPLWTSSTTLGDSALFQAGTTQIGHTTTTPASNLDLPSGFSIGSFAGSTAAPANGLIVSGPVGIGVAKPLSALSVNGALRLIAGSKFAGLQAAPASTVAWELPKGNGVAGQFLTTDGHGNLSWSFCAPPTPGCATQTVSGCQMGNTPDGGVSGTCDSGSTGTCSYQCSNTNWNLLSNHCSLNCAATTISGCVLTATPSGSTSGTCSPGYTGSCQFACGDGNWAVNSNSCSCPSGSKTYSSPGSYSFRIPTCYNSITVQVWGAGGGGQNAIAWPKGIVITGGSPGGDSNFAALVTATGGIGQNPGYGIGGSTNLTGQPGNWNGSNCPGLGGAGANGGGPDGAFPGGGGDGSCAFWGADGGGGGGYAAYTFTISSGALKPGDTVPVTVGAGGSDRGAAGQVVISWH